MADATLQILGLGQGLVPLGYNVTGDQSMDLVAVKADFDGTTAGTSFVPMVQIISPAGEVMAESQGTTVTAGDSATVTFAPFLRAAASAAPAGGSWQFSGYSAGVTTINKNTTGNLPVNTLLTGAALLDISTPTFPTVVAAGTYVFTCKFRLVLALSGNPTLGDSWQGKVTVDVGYDVADCLLTNPNPAGGYLPAISATTVPIPLAAGAGVTFSIRNSDTVKNLVFDSPNIGVSLFS